MVTTAPSAVLLPVGLAGNALEVVAVVAGRVADVCPNIQIETPLFSRLHSGADEADGVRRLR